MKDRKNDDDKGTAVLMHTLISKGIIALASNGIVIRNSNFLSFVANAHTQYPDFFNKNLVKPRMIDNLFKLTEMLFFRPVYLQKLFTVWKRLVSDENSSLMNSRSA